jgi:hypothetical protein
MEAWVRPLRLACVAAAVLAALAWALPRFGVVFVGGWSMAPTFTPGALALYRRAPVSASEQEVVLAAPPDGRPFVHRVTAVQLDGSLRTKGDANATVDPRAVEADELAGVVLVCVPSGKALHAVVSAVRWCYNHVPIANTRR